VGDDGGGAEEGWLDREQAFSSAAASGASTGGGSTTFSHSGSSWPIDPANRWSHQHAARAAETRAETWNAQRGGGDANWPRPSGQGKAALGRRRRQARRAVRESTADAGCAELNAGTWFHARLWHPFTPTVAVASAQRRWCSARPPDLGRFPRPSAHGHRNPMRLGPAARRWSWRSGWKTGAPEG